MRALATLVFCTLTLTAWAAPAAADTSLPDCTAETIGIRCAERREVIGPWSIEEVVPPVGSQNAIMISSPSFQMLPGLFARETSAQLILSCVENTTRFEVNFGENFMSDIQDLGTLVYKLDDRPPVALTLEASADNTALGLYSGAQAIPLIRGLIGGDRLLVNATTFTGRTLNVSFSVAELETAVASLRSLCNW